VRAIDPPGLKRLGVERPRQRPPELRAHHPPELAVGPPVQQAVFVRRVGAELVRQLAELVLVQAVQVQRDRQLGQAQPEVLVLVQQRPGRLGLGLAEGGEDVKLLRVQVREEVRLERPPPVAERGGIVVARPLEEVA
jgi:hypothetical protein